MTGRLTLALLAAALWAVPAQAAVSDAWITTKTKLALYNTENVPATSVNVDTVDGVVTLHGTVPMAEAKTEAEAAAKKVEGVKQVRNLLQVVPSSQKDVVAASDDEIKSRVEKALEADKGLAGSDIEVASVNKGVVVLSGTADTLSDHVRAVEDARGVPGVKRVSTEVKSPDRLSDAELNRKESAAEAGAKGAKATVNDAWLTSKVKLRLLGNEQTPARDINVDTRNGTVTLFGAVPSAAAKTAAETEAKRVDGVHRVVNALEVVPAAKKEQVEAKDDQIKSSVEHALKQRDDLKNADIDVDVKNGVVRLTGSVPAESERLAAAMTARSTAGVRAVREELNVKGEGSAASGMR
jgi:hyperosmotically inducible protein